MGTSPLLKDIRINAPIERGSACRLIQALSPALATGLIYCYTEGHIQQNSHTYTHTHEKHTHLNFASSKPTHED